MKKSIYLIVFLSLSLFSKAQQADVMKLHNQAQTTKQTGEAVRDFSLKREPLGNRMDLKIHDKKAEILETKSLQRESQSTSLLRAATDETSGTCGANGDNVRWTFDSSTGTLTISGTGEMADYAGNAYPPYDNYGDQIINVVIENGVTSIGAYAFYNYYNNLVSVTIPAGVTSIGEGAFNCNNLISVILPEGLTSIGDGAFEDCSSLASLSIPESVTNIGAYAFYGTLWYSNQPDGCVYVGKVLYAYKGSMPANTVIDVAEGTVSIAGIAFYNCNNLISVTLPNSLKGIGDLAFAYCFGLTSIEVAGTNPSYLSDNGVLFNKNKTILVCFPSGKLGNYTIPSDVKIIGYAAFIGSGISTVNIPNNVETISDYSFCNCTNLTTATISGNNLKSIGDDAFYGCTSLASLSIPGSVTNIGSDALYNTLWLNNQPDGIIYINNVLYRCKGSLYGAITVRDGTISISGNAFYDCGGRFSITLPESVKTIGRAAFANSSISSINIPNSVTRIEDYTFFECNFTAIAIGNSVVSIGYAAFANCKIDSIILPESLTSIEESAFNSCGLASITLPQNVRSIGINTFYNCYNLASITIDSGMESIGNNAFFNCTNITSITCNATKPPVVLGNWVFSPKTLIACTPVVPAASLALYQQAPGWREFYQDEDSGTCGKNLTWTLKYSDGMLTIHGTGEMDNYGERINTPWGNWDPIITQVVIENGATSIGNYAFSGCSLTSIIIGDSITSIGDNAFMWCYKLTSVIIGNNVTSIGDNAFYSCEGLTSITIPNSITSIGNFAFERCYNLLSVTIGNGVKSIGSYTFDVCLCLTSLVCYALTPPTVTEWTFDGVNTSSCTLYVPTNSIPLYQQADGWRDFYRIVTGIKETQTTQLSIYPNPISDSFRIGGITENTVVTILDMNGKTVLKRTVAPDETVWVGNLPNGIYFVTVNGKTVKMIKGVKK